MNLLITIHSLKRLEHFKVVVNKKIASIVVFFGVNPPYMQTFAQEKVHFFTPNYCASY